MRAESSVYFYINLFEGLVVKLIKTNVDETHPKHFKELLSSLNKSVVSDVNSRENIYYGEMDFLKDFGISKKETYCDTIISRIVGNIEPHADDLQEYSAKTYLLVLDVGLGNNYVNSQRLPILYQNREFLGLRKGDLVEFNQRVTHGLFWDRRIDIAVFWKNI